MNSQVLAGLRASMADATASKGAIPLSRIDPGQPDPHTKLQSLHTWKGGWGDANEDDKIVIGYICEWKAR
jgi:ribosome modulation factor